MSSSRNLMFELFVDCNLIRALCNKLQLEAEKIQEISMNAAIAAGHTGGHIKTFAEIARQIGNSSTRLASKVGQMRSKTNEIVNKTLAALISANQQSYFERCFPNVKNENNTLLIKNILEKIEHALYQTREEIYAGLQSIKSDLRSVEEIQRRVWAVITRLNIEASVMDAEEELFITSISETLKDSNDRSCLAFYELIEVIKKFEPKIINSTIIRKEVQYVSKNSL